MIRSILMSAALSTLVWSTHGHACDATTKFQDLNLTPTQAAEYELVQVVLTKTTSPRGFAPSYRIAAQAVFAACRLNGGRLVGKFWKQLETSPLEIQFLSFHKEKTEAFMAELKRRIAFSSTPDLPIEASVVTGPLRMRVNLKPQKRGFDLAALFSPPPGVAYEIKLSPWDVFDPGKTLALKAPFASAKTKSASDFVRSSVLREADRNALGKWIRKGYTQLAGFAFYLGMQSFNGWTENFSPR